MLVLLVVITCSPLVATGVIMVLASLSESRALTSGSIFHDGLHLRAKGVTTHDVSLSEMLAEAAEVGNAYFTPSELRTAPSADRAGRSSAPKVSLTRPSESRAASSHERAGRSSAPKVSLTRPSESRAVPSHERAGRSSAPKVSLTRPSESRAASSHERAGRSSAAKVSLTR